MNKRNKKQLKGDTMPERGIQKPTDFMAIDAVVVSEAVSRLVTEGRGLTELLRRKGSQVVGLPGGVFWWTL